MEHLGLKNHLTHFDYFCMLTARSTCRITFAWCLLGLFLHPRNTSLHFFKPFAGGSVLEALVEVPAQILWSTLD